MKITEGVNPNANMISAYDADRIVVNRIGYRESLLITPDTIESGWLKCPFEALDESALENLLVHGPEVILFGTGKRIQFPPAGVFRFFMNRGVGLEVMDTPAACRTYNLLAEDSRRVLAVLAVGA